jgi:peroxin-6
MYLARRLDRCVYLGVAASREAQLAVMQALTRKFSLAKDLDLRSVVSRCGLTFTGADFYALCSDAMLHALKRKIDTFEAALGSRADSAVERSSLLQRLSEAELAVEVGEADFSHALAHLTPSLTAEDLAKYQQVQVYVCEEMGLTVCVCLQLQQQFSAARSR